MILVASHCSMGIPPAKFRKRDLRQCARVALEERGLRVELKPGAGIVPGARLRTFGGAKEADVAVRTSLDREVGFTRHIDGHWMTIPAVDEVVVAVPSAGETGSVEVLCFDSEVILDAFNAALAVRQKESPEFSHKSPVFIALDPSDKGPAPKVTSGLKTRAKWRISVPLDAAPVDKHVAFAGSFVERVKREFAELTGVDVCKVIVEFRIIA